jgi:hypothetical protein
MTKICFALSLIGIILGVLSSNWTAALWAGAYMALLLRHEEL